MKMKLLTASVLLVFSGCSDSGSPDLETKQLVARCVQEPAIALQDYYSKPHIVSSVLDKAPVDQILETTIRNRAGDLARLSPEHRALVEAKMKEFVCWIDTNTTATAKSSTNPVLGRGGGTGVIDFPSSASVNEKGKSLCKEAFHEW